MSHKLNKVKKRPRQLPPQYQTKETVSQIMQRGDFFRFACTLCFYVVLFPFLRLYSDSSCLLALRTGKIFSVCTERIR